MRGGGGFQMQISLEKRYAGLECENEDRYYKRPEIQFPPITEGMQVILFLIAAIDTIQKQQLVDGVYDGMHALGDHGRAARNTAGDEFRNGDDYIGAEGAVDGDIRSGHGIPVVEQLRQCV